MQTWSQHSGERLEGGGLRVKGLTQLEIAQFVTASAKTVDHVLKQLRSDKLMETGRRSSVLPNPQLPERCLAGQDWRPGRGDVSRLSRRPDDSGRSDSTYVLTSSAHPAVSRYGGVRPHAGRGDQSRPVDTWLIIFSTSQRLPPGGAV